MDDPYARPEPPTITPEAERNLGTLAHAIPLAAMLLSAGVLGFVASLVVFVLYKDRGPFVRAHAANSLNVQITTGILLLVSVVLMFVLIGFVTYPIVVVWAGVLHALGLLKAHRGAWWKPPLTPRFVR